MPENLRVSAVATEEASFAPADPVKFAYYLDAKARGESGKRSGRRTRLKLMVATAELLESMIFTEMNVIDICKKAGVAKGTFYLQFETKEDVIVAIFREYVDFEIRTMPLLESGMNEFGSIYEFVYWYEQTFSVNAGIMRSFVRMSDTDPHVAELWKQRNDLIVERTVRPYLENTRFKKQGHGLAHLAVRTMGGIMDYALFSRYGIHQGSDFTQRATDETLIELHATLMYRALYGEDPPPEELKHVRQFLTGARRVR